MIGKASPVKQASLGIMWLWVDSAYFIFVPRAPETRDRPPPMLLYPGGPTPIVKGILISTVPH